MKLHTSALIILVPALWGTGKSWFFTKPDQTNKASLWVDRVLGLVVLIFSLCMLFNAI